MPDYISPDEDPRRQFQPFTAAQDAVAADRPQTFGDFITQAPPEARPQTVAELVQTRMEAEKEARKALNPLSRTANAVLQAIPRIGPAIASAWNTEDDVQRLAGQVAAEDFRQRQLQLAKQEQRQRLDLEKTHTIFNFLNQVAQMKDPKLRPLYLKSGLKYLGVEADPAIMAHFLAGAEKGDGSLKQLGEDLQNTPWSQLEPYFTDPVKALEFKNKWDQGQARELAATSYEKNVPGEAGKMGGALTRTGAGAAEIQTGMRAAGGDAASAALEVVGKMRATPNPDYNAMLTLLAPHLEDTRVASLNARLMAEQQAAGKGEEKFPTQSYTPEAVFSEWSRPGGKLAGKKWSELTSQETTAVNAEAQRRAVAYQMAAGQGRVAEWGNIRTVNMLDTSQGNRPVTIPVTELRRAASEEPGRYISAGAGVQALNKSALIEDIRGAIVLTRQSLTNLKTEFTAGQAAQIAIALGGNRGGAGALDAIFASSVGKTLTPEQVDYLTNLAQLKENAMAMRSVLGAGQGSDELRAAILATLPTARTPTRAYASTALDKFEAQINRLARGVPNVPLRGAEPPSAGPRTIPRVLKIEKVQ